MKRILLLGAGSGIALAYARQELEEGAKIVLAARHPEKLAPLLRWCASRGVAEQVRSLPFSAENTDPAALIQEAAAFLGEIDIVMIAFGTYRDQRLIQREPAEALL